MPDTQPYDPCHLWQDAVTSGATKIEQGVLAIENGDQERGEQLIQEGIELIEGNLPFLEQCRLDNPGSGPSPQVPPQPVPQQQSIRRISDSEVVSETADQRTTRLSIAGLKALLRVVKQIGNR
jgi:hypothetical protein